MACCEGRAHGWGEHSQDCGQLPADIPESRRCCWHPTGFSTSTLMAGPGNRGTEQVQCCYCGVPYILTWREIGGTIPGHGSQYQVARRVYDYPNLACPQRP